MELSKIYISIKTCKFSSAFYSLLVCVCSRNKTFANWSSQHLSDYFIPRHVQTLPPPYSCLGIWSFHLNLSLLHELSHYCSLLKCFSAARQSTGKRSLVISRSTFPSSGEYGGHWLGDNKASWDQLHTSIIGKLFFCSFQF